MPSRLATARTPTTSKPSHRDSRPHSSKRQRFPWRKETLQARQTLHAARAENAYGTRSSNKASGGRVLGTKVRSRFWAHFLGHPVGRDATVLTVGTVAVGPKSAAQFLGLVSGPAGGPAGVGTTLAKHATRLAQTLSVSHCSATNPSGQEVVAQ